MKKFLMSLLVCLFFILSVSHAKKSTWGWKYEIGEQHLMNGSFNVEIKKFYTGIGDTNYFVCAKVENIGKTEDVFKSSDIEVYDNKTGETFFSISKDMSVTLPILMSQGIIVERTLKPGQMIYGNVLFQTGRSKANSEDLKVSFKESSFEIKVLPKKIRAGEKMVECP